MRAAYYETNGPAREVLRVADVETPRPGPGEVRVRLLASGVNPSDVKSRAGTTRKIAFPRVIPHSDGAGEIDLVGDGVPPSRLGERVWVWNAQWRRPFGTAAEMVTLPAAQVVRLPANVSLEAAACLGIPAFTAYQGVELAGARAGSTVLVAAGAGAVGHYAIQFAKKRQATVITTVSSPAKAELARQAGADHTIDYKREDVGERVMSITGKRGVDAVIEVDIAANARLLPGVMAPEGVLAIYGTGKSEAVLASEASGQHGDSIVRAPDTRPEPGSSASATIPSQFLLQNAIALRFFLVYLMPRDLRERAAAEITRLLEGGELIHNVAQTFALADIAAAHEAVESGTAMGNIVLRIA